MTKPAVILLLLKRVDCNDGVASYVESLVTGLSDKGDRVVVVSGEVTTLYGSEARRESIRKAAIDWVVIKGLGDSRPKLAHLRAIISLIRLNGIDVVSPQGFAMLPIGCVAARLTGRPVVTNFHLLQGNLSARNRLEYRLVLSVFRADRYIAMSRDISDFFRLACRIPASRIHDQVLGVDNIFFRSASREERRLARQRFDLDDRALVSVLPGRLNLTKGHGLAAAAFRILRLRRPELMMVCLFAGGGDERHLIEADVLRDDADQAAFRFLGFVNRETMRDSYWASDIVVLPSTGEGFPLVVCEAMCCGAVVIRTPSSGWQEQVIEGKTGYVVPFNDPEALANAIEKVADSSDRSAMREAAMHLASSNFSRAGMINGTSALYREVAEAKKLRRRKSMFTAA